MRQLSSLADKAIIRSGFESPETALSQSQERIVK
jgi:hypothetical protein